MLISFLISIKGASSENHVSTYKSVFKILPPGQENVENVTPTSSLPMVNKFTHPVILSPYRYNLINHYDKHPSMINHHQYPKPQQYGYVEHPPIRYNYHQTRSLHQPRSLQQPVANND